jgi:hypothetical protein
LSEQDPLRQVPRLAVEGASAAVRACVWLGAGAEACRVAVGAGPVDGFAPQRLGQPAAIERLIPLDELVRAFAAGQRPGEE